MEEQTGNVRKLQAGMLALAGAGICLLVFWTHRILLPVETKGLEVAPSELVEIPPLAQNTVFTRRGSASRTLELPDNLPGSVRLAEEPPDAIPVEDPNNPPPIID